MIRVLFILFFVAGLHAQEVKTPSKFEFGACYGWGKEFDNYDYTFSNNYVQLQFYYSFNPEKKWEYQVALMPEINFAQHQLLNKYFVTPDDPEYERKRNEYTKLKDVRQVILNVAFFLRCNMCDNFNMYAMGNVGPMFNDTETERLNKGFAFNDVFAIGAAVSFYDITFDVRPSVAHVSNAGLYESNAGFNTYNISFGLIVPIE